MGLVRTGFDNGVDLPDTTDLTLARYEGLVQGVTRGVPLSLLCKLTNTRRETYDKWYQAGLKLLENYPDVSDHQTLPLLARFAYELLQAEQTALYGWLDLIDAEAQNGNLQAVMFRLKTRYPDEFGERTQITGKGGEPIQVAHSIQIVEVTRLPTLHSGEDGNE